MGRNVISYGLRYIDGRGPILLPALATRNAARTEIKLAPLTPPYDCLFQLFSI